MSTIYDIAKRVGRSPSTVARALSSNGYCSKAAREDVLRAAKELNYMPDQAAKALKSKVTHKIMLCIPDIMNPYYFSMINGANQVLEERQYHTILVYTNHDPNREMRMVESLKERFVDGLIMVSFDFSERLLRAIRDVKLPVVLTNAHDVAKYDGVFDLVYVDHTKATYLATEHLVQHGHREIAFLCGAVSEQTGRERLAGYREALERSGIAYDERRVIEADYTLAGGCQAIERFLEAGIGFSGVVSCNDLMGVGCLQACHARGLKIPRDFSMVTLDNTDYCLCTTPLLSSVNMMQDQIGRNAAEYVLEQIQGERNYRKKMILTPQLVGRESVRTV